MLTGRLDRLNPDCYINDFKAVYVLLSGNECHQIGPYVLLCYIDHCIAQNQKVNILSDLVKIIGLHSFR